ncbi:hypothetical protein E3N88_31545 [Mikania micrantha]|uniref:Uncharacterized protein n=1 Tax=Mikania micrantha TaxID=192012 RepID=A0A5N6MPQ9_9ASTR|nr:hypothetical protein E3N88_31545 [Mikania micrantha]
MMNSLMAKIQTRFGRIRTLHSMIISQETIKPSSPTPSHLKTHNLSFIDYLSPNIHMPLILFYKNFNNNNNINILKKSLSHSLTQYYPFAGRLHAPDYIDCNDEGVEFLEASVHSRLDDFILKEDQDETLDQLIPNALGCAVNKTSPHMVAVQLSHFTCGGVSVAVSVSHKAADAFTMVNFVNHWATLTRGELPINPRFFSSPSMSNFKIPELSQVETPQQVKYANRRFVFPNSKLNELKNKINAIGASPLDPTRVESLTTLLFKCAATITGSSRPLISLNQLVNLRGKNNGNFPQLAPGNFYAVATAMTKNSSQIEMNEMIMSLRKERMEVQGARDVEEAGKKMVDTWMIVLDDQIQSYSFSSVCRFPFYQVDFGWGNPARVMIRSGNLDTNFIVLMDTPSGDGIEATVQLEEEDMAIFQMNEQLHAYT